MNHRMSRQAYKRNWTDTLLGEMDGTQLLKYKLLDILGIRNIKVCKSYNVLSSIEVLPKLTKWH